MSTSNICTTCRACGSSMYSILDLGLIVPSDFLRPDQPDPAALPLDLCLCDTCGLVQLRHTADPDALFRQYWYRSGINETMRAELADIVQAAMSYVGPLKYSDTVVDVGANDGTLLSFYQRGSCHRIAYEPAFNLFSALQPHADVVVSDFFPGTRGLSATSVKVLTSIAMFYDLDDPRAFIAEVDRILTEDGVWILQFQDLAQMVEAGAFDNICHEHLCYYSLYSFAALLAGTNLRVADVERRAINGGSLRIVVRRLPYPTRPAVLDLLGQEIPVSTPQAVEKFAWRAAMTAAQIRNLVQQATSLGPVDLYAASTKSATLLQYAFLGGFLRQAVERTPEKVGLVTSGTRIPIVSEETWRADPAPVTLIGAWQFADTFQWRESAYLADGGTFLVPLPTPRLVTHEPIRRNA